MAEENKNIVDALNKYLQGVYMAIDTFNHYLSLAEEDETKKVLMNIYMYYKESAILVIDRITDLNGENKEDTGFIGKATEVFTNIKDSFTIKGDDNLMTTAYNSVQTGIQMGNKFLDENTLDPISKRLILTDLKNQDELLNTFPTRIPYKK